MNIEIILLSNFVGFRSAVSEEKSKMSQLIRGQGGHLVVVIGPKNTNLVEDIELFLYIKIRWIPSIGLKKMWKVNDGRTDNAWSQ